MATMAATAPTRNTSTKATTPITTVQTRATGARTDRGDPRRSSTLIARLRRAPCPSFAGKSRGRPSGPGSETTANTKPPEDVGPTGGLVHDSSSTVAELVYTDLWPPYPPDTRGRPKRLLWRLQGADQPADSSTMVCPDCVSSEHERRSNCRTCGRILTPTASEPQAAAEVRTESCPWCLLAERAGRDLCDMCGRSTDPTAVASPFWENV